MSNFLSNRNGNVSFVREEERVALAEKKHAEEVRFFTRTSQQLKAQLDGIMATKEK